MIITLKYRTGDRVEWVNAFGIKQRGCILSVDAERLRVRPDQPEITGVALNVVLPLPRVVKEG